MIELIEQPPARLDPAPAPPIRSLRRLPVDLLAVLLLATVVVASDARIPVLRPVAGLVLLVGMPALLVQAKLAWPARLACTERWLYSVGLTLLGAYLLGLVLNSGLPPVGLDTPLARWPILAAADLVLVTLLLWRSDQNPDLSSWVRRGWSSRALLERRAAVLLVGGVVAVLAAVTGAVRLNNGASGGVATSALVVCLLLLVLAFAWSSKLSESWALVTVYCTSLAMLLMTSMRGWYITGHDIQREYRVFELTAAAQQWDISVLRSAYNACLSLTVLPAMISELTAVPGLYVFKLLLQPLFAACPVLVFLLARRFCSVPVSLIGVVYFVAFPTYFTDMPFLVRQEVAFFFLALLLLATTSRVLSLRRRQVLAVAFGTGVVLSHYSTTYVLLVVLLAAWLCSLALRALPVLSRLPGVRPASLADREPLTLSAVVVLPIALLTVLWTGPATQTGGQFAETAQSVVSALAHHNGDRSSDTGYSLFSGAKLTPEERLAEYRQQTLDETAAERADGALYPLSVVDQYPTPVVSQPELPLTAVGRALFSVGVDVAAVNQVMRSWAAKVLQIFIVIGMGLVLLGRYRGRRIHRELVTLAGASFAMVLVQVLLPAVSVDYGLLRAFQQALFTLAAFLAVGGIAVFAFLGVRWSQRIAMAVASVFFLSLTGVIPQLLGGYPPQLHLNNAGQYYDIYYLQPQEVAGMEWLRKQLDTTPGVGQVHAEVTSDRFTASRLQTVSEVADDLYPTLLREDAYVFLGATTVTTGDVTLSHAGDLLTYRYPMELLDQHKSLIYANSNARIYR